MKFRALWLTLAGVGLLFTVHAQTGPGGVGNTSDNGLWLRADALQLGDGAPVGRWADLSGNGNDAFQTVSERRPVFVKNGPLNAMPSVRLDGGSNPDGDRLIIDDADILDGSVGITYFAVIRPSGLDGAPRGILGKRINQDTENRNASYAYTWYVHTANNVFVDINTQNDRGGTSNGLTNLTNYLLSFDYDGTRSTASRTRLLNGSEVVRTFSESSTNLFNSPQPVIIGGLNDNYPQYFGGDYAEIIHYNRSLSPLQRRLVNNYLSGKYALPLASGDVYPYDDVGDYDYDIAGIGRISAADVHADSQGSGMVSVSGPTDLTDDEYFLWGHDGEPTDPAIDDLPPGVSARLQRTWRVSEVDLAGGAVDVGAIDLDFDLDGVVATSESDLPLLVDTDDDGSFADEEPIPGARLVGAEVYRFDGVTALQHGRRFTVGQADSGFPIELTSFTATPVDRGVHLGWETATELNNDYFVVERLGLMASWHDVAELAGSGASVTSQRYTYLDSDVPGGEVYYRLRQVDYDGTFTHSSVQRVTIDRRDEAPLLYPNPADDILYLSGRRIDDEAFEILTAQGLSVTKSVSFTTSTHETLQLDLSKLSAGIYFLKSGPNISRFLHR